MRNFSYFSPRTRYSSVRITRHCQVKIRLETMWRLLRVISSFQLWFSDGEPINSTRGIAKTSSRLIIDTQGFLDLTDVNYRKAEALDANGLLLLVHKSPFYTSSSQSPHLAELQLTIVEDGEFQLSLNQSTTSKQGNLDASMLIKICEVLLSAEMRRWERTSNNGNRKAQTIPQCV